MNRRGFFKRFSQAVIVAVVAPYMALAPLRPSIMWAREAMSKARYVEFAAHFLDHLKEHKRYLNLGPFYDDHEEHLRTYKEFLERLELKR